MYRDDIYSLLNLSTNASEDNVKRAYRDFAKLHHPDLFPGDQVKEEQFKRVNAAYQSWKLIHGTVDQIRRLRNAAGASARAAGFQPWNLGKTAAEEGRAKFRPWKLDVWA